jgi:hypothetical protein
MEWRGIDSNWKYWSTRDECRKPLICTWRPADAADAAGRPHGHGVLAYPGDNMVEFQEGRMVAGIRQGPWVTKWLDGKWRSSRYVDDAIRDDMVHPLGPRAPAPPAAQAPTVTACGAPGGSCFLPCGPFSRPSSATLPFSRGFPPRAFP